MDDVVRMLVWFFVALVSLALAVFDVLRNVVKYLSKESLND